MLQYPPSYPLSVTVGVIVTEPSWLTDSVSCDTGPSFLSEPQPGAHISRGSRYGTMPARVQGDPTAKRETFPGLEMHETWGNRCVCLEHPPGLLPLTNRLHDGFSCYSRVPQQLRTFAELLRYGGCEQVQRLNRLLGLLG